MQQTENVIKRLAYKRPNIREKVDDIMGGKVLKMEWLERFDAAAAKGREEGREEGEKERRKLEAEKYGLEARIKSLEKELEELKAAAM